MRRALSLLFLFGYADGCASTAPGRGYVPEGGYPDTSVSTTDGGSWSDAGQCPPMTFAGSPCKGVTSCWQDCFACLGNPPSWDKRMPPLSYKCVNGEYGTNGAVTCWNGRYKDIQCTTPFDGGK